MSSECKRQGWVRLGQDWGEAKNLESTNAPLIKQRHPGRATGMHTNVTGKSDEDFRRLRLRYFTQRRMARVSGEATEALAHLKLLHGSDGDLRGAQQQAAGLVPVHHTDLSMEFIAVS